MLAQLEPLATTSGGMTPMGTAPITGVSPRTPRPRLLAAAISLIVVAAVIGVVLSRREHRSSLLGLRPRFLPSRRG